MSQSPAPFVWYELMTTDAAAAEKFYKDVVGWKAQDMSQGDMKYTGLLAADMPVAGLMTLPKDACDAGAKPGWTGYIGVDDVDTTAGRVTKAIVDRAKVVEVQQDHGKRRGLAPVPSDCLRKSFHEQHSIRQAGQRIVQAFSTSPLCGSFAQALAPTHCKRWRRR